MNNSVTREKIDKLVEELNYHTKLYDAGDPIISDKEWDEKYFRLVKMEKAIGYYNENSPTQRVNYQLVNKLNKVTHSHPMLSLDKTKSLDDINSFCKNREVQIMAKMDGLTCSLTYRGGRLVGAETRGNGLVGEDILHNALVIKNIPKKIEYQEELVVDGEVICTYKNFEQFKDEYKNPRNFASGSIRLLDSKESEKRNLSFVAWDVIKGFSDNEFLSTKLFELLQLGFTIVPSRHGVRPQNDVIKNTIEDIQEECQEFGYPIDGIVFKYDNVKEYEDAGKTDHHFKGGIAYKFYDEEYETTLKDITYDIGRTGVLTPVAIYEDIDIDGTVCSRASLHNISILEDTLHGPGFIGQKVKIAKMNMIIPQIVWAEGDEVGVEKEYIKLPTECPICGGGCSIHISNDSKILMCDNPDCEGKVLNRLDHFAGKKGLDIKGLSKATLEKLMDWNWIQSYQDFFILKQHRDQWIKKPGFGPASVDKILNAIEEARANVTLEKVIAAAGIPEIGSRVAKDLAQNYDSWSDFRAETNFLQYDGIGEIMNENLLNFDYDSLNLDYTVNLFLKDNIIKNKEEKETITNSLEGKVFCITGKLKTFKNRNELIADIESKGGKAVSTMSSKVNYLINNDSTSTSSKSLAAQKAGIPIITEEEYLNM